MKSRGVYENAAGRILYTAIKEIDMLTMDADTISMKGILSQKYAELVYVGKWFSPTREAIDAFLDRAYKYATGEVRLVLYKGNIIIAGRKSPLLPLYRGTGLFR